MHSHNLDEELIATCLIISRLVWNQPPVSPTDMLVPQTSFFFNKLSLSNNGDKMTTMDMVSNETCLTEKYPYAYSDFYGHRGSTVTLCVFKSGPDYHIHNGPQA